MLKVKDPREVEDFAMNYEGNGIKVFIKGGYMTQFRYIEAPTGNCQLASAYNFCNVMPYLNKYKIRDLFIKMRKGQFILKRILLLDLNRKYANNVVEWLAPGSIIGNMPYKSTNGSQMNILLINLSLVRQLQLPK
jgi:hypothetical protein